jgi:hypothetical protein
MANNPLLDARSSTFQAESVSDPTPSSPVLEASDDDDVHNKLAVAVLQDQGRAVRKATKSKEKKEEVPFIKQTSDLEPDRGRSNHKCKGCSKFVPSRASNYSV